MIIITKPQKRVIGVLIKQQVANIVGHKSSTPTFQNNPFTLIVGTILYILKSCSTTVCEVL